MNQPATQVISFKADGSIKGLQLKAKGLDLRNFGNASIKRATEIEWWEDSQRWAIRFLQGKLKGTYATRYLCTVFNVDLDNRERLKVVKSVLLFEDYDNAVAMEVELLQAMMKSGKESYVFD
jgi:hypothetical protein